MLVQKQDLVDFFIATKHFNTGGNNFETYYLYAQDFQIKMNFIKPDSLLEEKLLENFFVSQDVLKNLQN